MRLGRIRIEEKAIVDTVTNGDLELLLIMANVLVLEAKQRYDMAVREYLCYSPQFRDVKATEQAPLYVWFIGSDYEVSFMEATL